MSWVRAWKPPAPREDLPMPERVSEKSPACQTPSEPKWGQLTPASEGLALRPLASLGEVVASLPSQTPCWGFYTTPTIARLLRAPRSRWEEIAGPPHLQELRIFGPERDLHWLGDRGVELAVVPAPSDPSPDRIGGPGWLQRDRRSRLWGEPLGDTGTWYEERIPDPLRYEGLEPGSHRFAFLVYREYVQAGAVRYVRYLEVEGGTR
jgi:hypothetical protein